VRNHAKHANRAESTTTRRNIIHSLLKEFILPIVGRIDGNVKEFKRLIDFAGFDNYGVANL